MERRALQGEVIMMELLAISVYGLFVGHIMAGYALYAEYPRLVKIFALATMFVLYLGSVIGLGACDSLVNGDF